MEMQEIAIKGTENLIEDQETERRIEERLQMRKEAGQFNEHRQPPNGFDRISQIFGDNDAAWYWLTVPNDALDGVEPLALLHKGEVTRVEVAATGNLQGDFG